MSNAEATSAVSRSIDLQINGAFGVDFADPALDGPRLLSCVEQLKSHGLECFYATVITSEVELLCRQLARLAELKRFDPVIDTCMRGIHLEGPFLSPLPGYVGAHRPEATCDATISLCEKFHNAAQGLLRLVTLAPERDSGGQATKWLVNRGVGVAAGHTNASYDEIRCAIDCGLSLFTHYGNGCPQLLPRHDNILQRALRLHRELKFTVIADGVHLPPLFLENLVDHVGIERLIVISDAIHAAGQGAGNYQLGGSPIVVDSQGIPRTVDGNYLAGSGWLQFQMDSWLASRLGWSREWREQVLRKNPLSWIQSTSRM